MALFCRYDAFSSILGEGKPFVGIDNSYLQSGHTVLLALVLVCAFIDLPGFPLTSLPYDVRGFLKVWCMHCCVCVHTCASHVSKGEIYWSVLVM